MMPLGIALVVALGTMVEIPPPEPVVIHQPLDLTAVMNADPWDSAVMAVPDLPFAETPFVSIEGEAAFRSEGAEIVPLPNASGGAALRGLGAADDWAEWAFDIPFDSNEAVLYARVSRPFGENEDRADGFRPFTILTAAVNSRPGGVGYVNASSNPEEFADGFVKFDLGRVRMGRQLLRLGVRMPGEPVLLDCLWLGARTLDLRNELDPDGRMLRPFSIAVLAYEPGRHEADGIPLDLVDPRMNEGRGAMLPTAEGIPVPMDGKQGSALLLLGAGSDTPARAIVTIAYADGDEEDVEVRWPALYDRNPAIEGEVTVPLGLFRRATVRRVPLRASPLTTVILRPEGRGRPVVLAATLEYHAP